MGFLKIYTGISIFKAFNHRKAGKHQWCAFILPSSVQLIYQPYPRITNQLNCFQLPTLCTPNGTVAHSICHEGETMSSATYSENKDPGFAMINVYVDPGAPGHTAIGADGRVLGFYPEPGSKSNMWGSNMSYHDESSPDFLKGNTDANIFFLKVSPEEKDLAMGYALSIKGGIDRGNGPEYTVYSNNCTSVIGDALIFAKIKFTPMSFSTLDGQAQKAITPSGFNSYLKTQYEMGKAPVSGWLDRGNAIVPSSDARKKLGIGRDVFHN